ncbi:MAG: hypothetical protein QXL02_02470 [Candidatus Anstonellales archaeon]
MIYWIFALILLAGCLGSSSDDNTQPDPIKLEFKHEYNQTILSLWESMLNRSYRFQALESIENRSTYVDATVLGDDYNIKLDIFGDGGLVYYAYKNENLSRYCVVLMNRFLNCTDSEMLFRLGLRDYGSESVFAYIFNRSVVDSERDYINSLTDSPNISISKVDNGYKVFFKLSDLKMEDLRKLGFSVSDITRIDSIEINIYFQNSGYRIEQYQYLTNGSIIRKDSQVNISLEISNLGDFELDEDKYSKIMLRDMINVMNYYLLIKSGYYSDETEIYKLAVATGVPEYCLYTSKRDTCISYYVHMTGDKRACDLIGIAC